jgi:hypothetical protein
VTDNRSYATFEEFFAATRKEPFDIRSSIHDWMRRAWEAGVASQQAEIERLGEKVGRSWGADG